MKLIMHIWKICIEKEWAKKKLIHLDLNNKLILDIGSGLGFF